jgi:hypothetical protein
MDEDRIELIQETVYRKLSKPYKPEKGLFCTWVHDRYHDVMALFSSEELETVDPALAEALDRFLRDRVWVKAASMQVINEMEKLEPVPKRQQHSHRLDFGLDFGYLVDE